MVRTAPGHEAPTPSIETCAVEPRHDWHIGSLRYFDGAGSMGANLRGAIGGPLPGPLAAVRYEGARADLILAWRSPTETLIMTADEAAFSAVASRAAVDRSAGYLVDQTGGVRAWRLAGARARELLQRIGSAASIPAAGEARSGRLGELPVLVLSVLEGEFVLLVERLYSEHLRSWIDATTADM